MAYDHLAKLDVEGLQGYFSDFHKDFYGSRHVGVLLSSGLTVRG